MSVVNYASIKMYKKVGVNYARPVERNTRKLCMFLKYKMSGRRFSTIDIHNP